MHQRRHIPFVAWLLAPALLAGALVWIAVRRPPAPMADTGGRTASAGGPAPVASSGRDVVADRMTEVLEISRSPTANAGKLIAAYGKWAAEPGALVPRKMILDAILKQDSYVAKASALMQAVEGATLPPEEDPLWPQAVAGLSEIWDTRTLSWGLDSMLAEERPRARHLLIESLARMALSQRVDALTETQRTSLLHDIIDVKLRAPDSVRDEIEDVIRKLMPPLTET
jgi:hypothetical protein